MNLLEEALLKTIKAIEPNKEKIIKHSRKLKKCVKCGHWYSENNHSQYCKK